MASPWERLFTGAARVFAWSVALTPVAIVAILVAASLAGKQRPDPVLFLGHIVVELVATLLIAALGSAAGTAIGLGTALFSRELVSGRLGQVIAFGAEGLAAFPAVVLGWFCATLILPVLSGRPQVAVFGAAFVIVMLAVIPRANVLAKRCLGALPDSIREAAAAAGASPARITAHVTLPACAEKLVGILADAFARGMGEAAGVSIVFLAAARAGYPVALFTIPSTIMAHAQTTQLIDAGIAEQALIVLFLAAISRRFAVHSLGGLLWV